MGREADGCVQGRVGRENGRWLGMGKVVDGWGDGRGEENGRGDTLKGNEKKGRWQREERRFENGIKKEDI